MAGLQRDVGTVPEIGGMRIAGEAPNVASSACHACASSGRVRDADDVSRDKQVPRLRLGMTVVGTGRIARRPHVMQARTAEDSAMRGDMSRDKQIPRLRLGMTVVGA
jgi:ABC-type Fe2+-enterobactin transport system substrate-binding protein